jgi:hypothetical protein
MRPKVCFFSSLAKKEKKLTMFFYQRIRNSAKLRPIELVDPRNKELRTLLQRAEYSIQVGDDVVREDDDGPTGSGSESD